MNSFRPWMAVAMLGLAALASGCAPIVDRAGPRLIGPQGPSPLGVCVPTEKDKTTLPTYVIEPPDILSIEAIRLIPKSPYHLQPTDVVSIEVTTNADDPTTEPLQRNSAVDTDGNVDLGARYGENSKVRVAGLTTAEAAAALREVVLQVYRKPRVSVSLVQSSALQPVVGEHLVASDGSVNLGNYGLVYVAGMTLEEATAAIRTQLEKKLDNPQVSVSVFTYNSKTYYVITQGAGSGDSVLRVAHTGNETVLDAIAQINGLSRLSSKRIWIARPAPSQTGCYIQLPVNWDEITSGGLTASNYQVLPGDRVFIAENKMIAFDAALNKLIAPFERIMGFTLLSTQTIQNANRFPEGLQGGGAGF